MDEDPSQRHPEVLAEIQRDQMALSKALRSIRDGAEEEEIYFDPGSGKLLVKRKGHHLPKDAVPATKMAKEGFFHR